MKMLKGHRYIIKNKKDPRYVSSIFPMVSDIEVPARLFDAFEDITEAAPIMLDDTNHRHVLADILETTGAEQ